MTMNDEQKSVFLRTCQYAIGVCKEEVEKSIPASVMAEMDAGSPWGRALIRCMGASNDKSEPGIDSTG